MAVNRNLKALTRSLGLAAAAFSVACAGGTFAVTSDEADLYEALNERRVAPASIDAAASNWLEDHIVASGASPAPGGPLFVFLPGTYALPDDYRWLLKEAALRGHRAIGLRYANTWALSRICNTLSDLDCHGLVREEILFGRDVSPLVNVSPADSVVGRLKTLLAHLADEYPEEGWSAYLKSDGDINWEQVSLSGYSQGAGHAAFLAKQYRVLRVGLYSGPADVSLPLGGRPASWLYRPSATPYDAYFGFTHAEDEVLQYSHVLRNWSALGLSEAGPAVNVDRSAAPFRFTRQLVTRMPPAQTSDYARHGATVRDGDTPRDPRNLPIYRAVWGYVSFP